MTLAPTVDTSTIDRLDFTPEYACEGITPCPDTDHPADYLVRMRCQCNNPRVIPVCHQWLAVTHPATCVRCFTPTPMHRIDVVRRLR